MTQTLTEEVYERLADKAADSGLSPDEYSRFLRLGRRVARRRGITPAALFVVTTGVELEGER